MKTAVILGASGLVGSQLLKILIDDKRIDVIKIFVRKPQNINSPKVREFVVDFDFHNSWAHNITGDVLFSAFGTTLKKAGSKKEQFKIDYIYQYRMARSAADNGIPAYVLVSSASANAKSCVFYLRLKGVLDENVKKLNFKSINILKPSLLLGKRKDKRLSEGMASKLAPVIEKLPGMQKYKAIHADKVATAMVNSYFKQTKGFREFVLMDIFRMA